MAAKGGEDAVLSAIQAQLLAIQSQINTLAQDRTKQPPTPAAAAPPASARLTPEGATPTPTGGAGHKHGGRQPPPHLLARVMSVEVPSSEDELIRPSVYSHRPEARLDALEAEALMLDDVSLDLLKLENFEGFYNLSFMLLIFALVYMVARSFKDKGVLLDIDDFLCAPLHRDIAWVGALMVAAYAWSFTTFALVHAWVVARRISWSFLLYAHGASQVVLLFTPITILYLSPTAPLPSAALLMVIIVIALKQHSYVATNYAIHKEHKARYGDMLLAAASTTTSTTNSSSSSIVGGGGGAFGSVNARLRNASFKGALPSPAGGESTAAAAGTPTPGASADATPPIVAGSSKAAKRRGGGGGGGGGKKRKQGKRRTGGSSSRGGAGDDDGDGGDEAGSEGESAAALPPTSSGISGGVGAYLHRAGVSDDEDGDDDDDDDEEGEFDLDDERAQATLLRRRITSSRVINSTGMPASSPTAASLGRSSAIAMSPLMTPTTTAGLTAATGSLPPPLAAAVRSSSTGSQAGSPPTALLLSTTSSSATSATTTTKTTALAAASLPGVPAGGIARLPSPSPDASASDVDWGVVGASMGDAAIGGYLGTAARLRRTIKRFPDNITARDFLYFLAVPSLVYEPRYPRTRRIRWRYVARKLLEAFCCGALQYLLFKQFILPPLKNPSTIEGLGPLGDVVAMVFDLMKLAVPSMAMWLSGFYAIFHCWLNVLAEVTRFADRYFYAAWWNSTTLDAFWRRWNVPVHEWCLRHVFVDLQSYSGVSKGAAILGTFFFSAVFHELIFSVSFKTFRPWFFAGMLLQIPLIAMGKSFSGTRRGNLLVWWSLFSGQPLLELLYFREFFKTHDSFFCNSGGEVAMPAAL